MRPKAKTQARCRAGWLKRQRVARAPEEGRTAREILTEPTYERRLPRPRLAADEDEAPASPGGVCERGLQLRLLALALQESTCRSRLDDRHHRILTSFAGGDNWRDGSS